MSNWPGPAATSSNQFSTATSFPAALFVVFIALFASCKSATVTCGTKYWITGPVGPVQPVTPRSPIGPVTPRAPVGPAGPVTVLCRPVGPVIPLSPVEPVQPVGPVWKLGAPVGPVKPVGAIPVGPVGPVSKLGVPVGPVNPVGATPVGPVQPVSPWIPCTPWGPVKPVGPNNPSTGYAYILINNHHVKIPLYLVFFSRQSIININMVILYSGSVPQGSQIVYEFNPEFTYVVEPAKTLCFPFMIKTTWLQIVIELADITPFQNCFVPVLRSWASKEISGESLTNSPRTIQNTTNLSPYGLKYNFWLPDYVTDENIHPSDINHAVFANTQYWMNVQNLQNKTSNLYCKFTLIGKSLSWTQ